MPTVTAAGVEFLVNQSTLEAQFQPVTVALDGGKFAAFWVDYAVLVPGSAVNLANADIRGRIFNGDGTAAGDEFFVNTTTAGTQYRPQVTRLSDGNLLIAWQDGVNPGGSTSAVFAQEITASGTRVGAEFQIGTPGLSVGLPEVEALAGGGFVAIWQGTSVSDLFGQRFDAANAPVGSQFTIPGSSVGANTRPDITVLTDGKFVVSWNAFGGISFRLYDSNAIQIGFDSSISGNPQNSVSGSRVTALADGGFLVTAVAFNNQNPQVPVIGLGYRFHDAVGNSGAEGLLTENFGGGARFDYDISARADGGFVAAWVTNGATGDGSGTAIAAQIVRANGNLVGAPLIANTVTPGDQFAPDVSSLANGDFVVAWQGSDASSLGINARLFTVTPGNTAPIAVNDGFDGYDFNNIDAAILLDNDTDIDGDTLTILSVGNARAGSVILSNGVISFTPAAGFSGPAVFDYTISDGAGGIATATATFIGNRNDTATVRGAGPHFIDVLANDFLALPQQSYVYSANVPQNDGSIRFIGTPSGQQLLYTPLQTIFPDYFNLLVGQTKQVFAFYSVVDPGTGVLAVNANVEITLQGWAQIGDSTAETLLGGALADHLSGGTGAANTLSGAAGDDWYTVQAAGDVIIEAPDGGFDSVRTTLQALELAANVESLAYIGNTGDFTGVGNAANNRLNGGNFADTLIGLGGDDVLFGGNGADLLFGGDGNDTYVTGDGDIVFEAANGGTDTVNAGNSFYLFANIENLNLAQGNVAVFGVGNDLANTINGNDISNLIIGGGGNDALDGKGGVDSLFGQDGDDSLVGGAGIDYLVGGTGNDRLEGGTDADALYGQDGNDILVGGSDFQTDIFVGGDGNDTLNAASGLGDYDLIDGGAGDDVYYVDTPADLTFEALNAGTDTIVANIVGAGYYLYANTENLILEGVTPFGVGNELDNALTGNAIGNYLLGGQGNDTLNGKAGNDVLFGEAGIDSFVFERGTGGDLIGDFQPGVDRIQLTGIGFTSYAQLSANFVEVAGTTAINLGEGDFIVLTGVSNSMLSAVDFLLG